jgi:hypothetical protein
MIRLTLFAILLFSLASCNPAVYRTYKDDKADDSNHCGLVVVRFYIPDSVATKIGEILIDDIGASVNCSEEQTIHYLMNEGCSAGAHIISIRDVKRPDNESYCYRCTALLYQYKPGAKPIKANKYFDMVNIKKREQKDRKHQIKRTIGVIDTIRHIIYILTFRHYENPWVYPFL